MNDNVMNTRQTKRQNDSDEDRNAPLRKGRGRQLSTNPETSVVLIVIVKADIKPTE